MNTLKLIDDISNLLEQLKNELSDSSDFDKLKRLLESNDWPAAVALNLICDESSEIDKEDRANGIFLSIDADLNNVKFLDFGCGEGHVVKVVKDIASLAVGYDIEQPKLDSEDSLIFTNSLEIVKEKAPYDVILLYDVLDHVADPVKVLKEVRSFCHNDSKVFVVAHPWCGRHAGHLYKIKNKAFMHLIFEEKELLDMNINSSLSSKIKFPLGTYNGYFIDAGFSVVSEHVERDPIEDFFLNNLLIRNRIMQHWERGVDGEFPSFQMEQSFVNYQLALK